MFGTLDDFHEATARLDKTMTITECQHEAQVTYVTVYKWIMACKFGARQCRYTKTWLIDQRSWKKWVTHWKKSNYGKRQVRVE